MTARRVFQRGNEIPVTFLGTCEETGKRQYSSRADAKQVRGDRSLKPYRCGACGLFHLGHLPPRVKGGAVDRSDLKSQR